MRINQVPLKVYHEVPDDVALWLLVYMHDLT